MNNLENTIQKALMSAMKEKDEIRVSSLRSIKTAIQNEKVNGAYHELSDTDIVKIIQKLSKQRIEAEEIYRNAGREELADREKLENDILSEFIPKQLSESELKEKIHEIISELGVSSIKEMGRVMGELNKRYVGLFDGKTASGIVRVFLS